MDMNLKNTIWLAVSVSLFWLSIYLIYKNRWGSNMKRPNFVRMLANSLLQSQINPPRMWIDEPVTTIHCPVCSSSFQGNCNDVFPGRTFASTVDAFSSFVSHYRKHHSDLLDDWWVDFPHSVCNSTTRGFHEWFFYRIFAQTRLVHSRWERQTCQGARQKL